MTSNLQDSAVVQEPKVVHGGVTQLPIDVAVEPPQARTPPRSWAELRATIRGAFGTWTVGRRTWDRAQAWMAAHRSVRAQTASGAPPTQHD